MLNKLTVTRVTMHSERDSPIFGDTAVHFWLDDEGAGAFVRISGPCDTDPVKFDFEDLTRIQEAFAILQKADLDEPRHPD